MHFVAFLPKIIQKEMKFEILSLSLSLYIYIWSFWATLRSIWDLISNRKSLIVFQICWVKILWDSWCCESYKKTSIGNWIESFHELNIPYGSLVMDSLNLSKATQLVSFDGMAKGVAGCKHSRVVVKSKITWRCVEHNAGILGFWNFIGLDKQGSWWTISARPSWIKKFVLLLFSF